jgi:3D-(3,5/4)-trihydroxycyclohexane-1,2-dione acylhydrolase (decyclizing)
MPGTGGGGSWWEVAVPEVSVRPEVQAARDAYVAGAAHQALVR